MAVQTEPMMLIEAMKKAEDLKGKVSDLRKKVQNHSAYRSDETPVYGDSQEEQTKQVKQWMDCIRDTLAEIMRLRIAVQCTNLITPVTIQILDKHVTHTIAEWIHRRGTAKKKIPGLAEIEYSAWMDQTDRGINEGYVEDSQKQKVQVHIVRCYDPKERDIKMAEFVDEPQAINRALEVANATTPLVPFSQIAVSVEEPPPGNG